MTILPQLDEAIAYLQADIRALRAGEKDSSLLSVAVSVAAGEAPLPEPQFAPLLALWTPKEDPIATELAALVDQFEAVRQREEEEDHKKEDRDVKTPIHSALERVRGQRRRPRTRPRRRFEDPDEGDASQSASDGTPTPSPRADDTVVNTVVVKEKEKEEVDNEKEKNEEKDQEKKDVVMEKIKVEAEEKQVVVEENEEKKTTSEDNQDEKSIEKEKREDEKPEEEKERNPEKEEAEAALASLKALRKSMLLDVLSKIVSVAKSKNVDPAMFSKKPEEKMVDLEKIQERVSGGIICEWAQFAEQVYLFCQEVVTDAEKREQAEARRKGVELLHFARTLTETLRKASVKKEAILLQKIREAEEEAAARKEEDEAAQQKEEMGTDDKIPLKEEEQVATVNEGGEKVKAVVEGGDVEMENATASEKDNQADSHESGKADASGPPPLTPTRASTRIRKRTSITSDGTGSAAPSPSSHPRKRTRGSSIFTASASEVSGEESHDASASEADTKQRGGTPKAPKTPAKRTRKRRPSVPATRTSSRQQKRRAEAAAATVAESGGSGVEEEHSGGEVLHSADDGNEKEKPEETETGEDEHEEEQAPKKKKTKTRTRKKGGRKK
ncbi:hypothetical protein P3T76_008969 [Phytophthora citrophthora]|uniref:Uncharacterized protein n=1 Tax=Phytophthora citrophthora TaxID=4793 RepID=A0AAD9GHZ1_9STRA|nr:hypothetical protein P3T76_008969 [Phytophthora citrophthora]